MIVFYLDEFYTFYLNPNVFAIFIRWCRILTGVEDKTITLPDLKRSNKNSEPPDRNRPVWHRSAKPVQTSPHSGNMLNSYQNLPPLLNLNCPPNVIKNTWGTVQTFRSPLIVGVLIDQLDWQRISTSRCVCTLLAEVAHWTCIIFIERKGKVINIPRSIRGNFISAYEMRLFHPIYRSRGSVVVIGNRTMFICISP